MYQLRVNFANYGNPGMNIIDEILEFFGLKKKPSPVTPLPPPAPASPPRKPLPIPASPTFSDNFNTGTLSSNWIVSNYTSDNYAGAGSNVQFSPSAIDMSQGCLCIKLTQPTAASSVGGELQLNQKFGYGTYSFTMRASSTSPIKGGAGNAVSGQISAVFNYLPDASYNSITEIDAPEIEGQHPNQLSYTSWVNGVQKAVEVPFQSPEAGFHVYKYVWAAGKIDFYVDGMLVTSITSNVPTQAASPIINHWGTNSTGWGGVATPGVDRYMYVSNFTFTAA
jgi:beta-glucanase (GH16 family)